jgi:iron complex outermembrane receptor protein
MTMALIKTLTRFAPMFPGLMSGLLWTAAAHAQSIDHGAFEALFGEPVTTSATGAPQRASDVPAAMTIVTGEELRRIGARNLAEALKGRAGIDVNRMTGQDDEVGVRGGNQPANPRLLVMVNGRQVYLDHYGLTSWSNLGVELSEIRQVEVVKGPVSALFGFNAASGAINIVTYDPLTDDIHTLTLEAGNDDQRRVSVVGTLRQGADFGIRLSGGYETADEFATLEPVDPHRPRRANLALDAHARLAPRLDARFNLNLTDSRQTLIPPGFYPVGMRYQTKGGMGELSADTGAGLLSLAAQYNDLYNRFDYFAALPGEPERAFDVHLFSARFQDIVKLSARDTLRATAELRTNEMVMTPDLGGKLRYAIYSGGLMWDRHLNERLTVNLAARVDHLDRDHSAVPPPPAPAPAPPSSVPFVPRDFDRLITVWSGNAGLVAQFGPASTLRAQAARGVQAPSLVSTGMAVIIGLAPGVDQGVFGNPDMVPTVTDSAEIGYARDLPAIGGKLAATLFWSRTREVAMFADLPPRVGPFGLLLRSGFRNQGSFESYGLEATLSGKAGPSLRWQLDYTFNAMDEDFDPSTPATSAPFKALTPRHKIGLALAYTRGPVSLDLRGLLRSRVDFPYDGRVSGWTAGIDGRAGFRLSDHVEFFGSGENLTGAEFLDNGFIHQKARVRIGLRVSG